MDGDPGTPDEANPYDYVGNDPLNFTDPLGLKRESDDSGTWSWLINLAAACVDRDVFTECPVPDELPRPEDYPWYYPDPWYVITELWDYLNASSFEFVAAEVRRDLIIELAFDYSDPDENDVVYRVHDGSFSDRNGASWTPVDPEEFERSHFRGAFRFFSGLPDGNSGTLLVEGVLLDESAVVKIQPALPLPTSRLSTSAGTRSVGWRSGSSPAVAAILRSRVVRTDR